MTELTVVTGSPARRTMMITMNTSMTALAETPGREGIAGNGRPREG